MYMYVCLWLSTWSCWVCSSAMCACMSVCMCMCVFGYRCGSDQLVLLLCVHVCMHGFDYCCVPAAFLHLTMYLCLYVRTYHTVIYNIPYKHVFFHYTYIIHIHYYTQQYTATTPGNLLCTCGLKAPSLRHRCDYTQAVSYSNIWYLWNTGILSFILSCIYINHVHKYISMMKICITDENICVYVRMYVRMLTQYH
jgi:hypothetical protein